MKTFNDLFENASGPILLDGGLGTTLEAQFSKRISNTILWSAQLLSDDPESIIQAHLAFLKAGARVISTSTYQASYRNFDRAGYARSTAARLMLNSVKLASQARERFCAERPDILPADIKIALSLGPFGATLSPTQEYGGFYPPPYGPEAYSPTRGNQNMFLEADEGSESDAEKALMEFHFERLALFANADDETWTQIDCFVFETIPLLREVRSIKRAVRQLNEQFGEAALKKAKPWWISLVFPDGIYPEMSCANDKGRIAPQVAAQAVLEEVEGSVVPNGIGLNCISIEYLPELLVAFGKASLEMQHHGLPRPWLVLYPNGGDVYDPVTKAWRENSTKDRWGDSLACIVKNLPTETWAGVLVGGCCRASPKEIELLAETLRPGECAS